MTHLAQDAYLDSFLAPFAPFLSREDISDIFVNRPGELWLETTAGQIERLDLPSLTEVALERLARQVAAKSAQGISRQHPLLTAALPDGSRIQIIQPPATRNSIVLAIRKHAVEDLSLSDFIGPNSAKKEPKIALPKPSPKAKMTDSGDWIDLLSRAVRDRKNILISGGTSTGKTTLLNTLLHHIPRQERLVLIEDAPELKMTHANAIGLLASRSQSGEADVTAEDLLIASLRMRPDRIILGEMRGGEVMTFLRAVNTGHPGSISTIHADSPERAIDQLALLVLQSGARMAWGEIVDYVKKSLNLIVHLSRENGKRQIDQIQAI